MTTPAPPVRCCRVCKRDKPFDHFRLRTDLRTRRHICRSCEKVREGNRSLGNPEQHTARLERRRTHYHRHRAIQLQVSHRRMEEGARMAQSMIAYLVNEAKLTISQLSRLTTISRKTLTDWLTQPKAYAKEATLRALSDVYYQFVQTPRHIAG